jgi:PrgI family protein
MEYQVPQFIEVEDKIFGPLTIKQFIYLAGGGGLIAIIVLSLPLVFAIVLGIPIAALSGALAFYKINGKPFIEILESGFLYLLGGRLYLWKKEKNEVVPEVAPEAPKVSLAKAPLSRRKLEDLAWSLDVRDTGSPQS